METKKVIGDWLRQQSLSLKKTKETTLARESVTSSTDSVIAASPYSTQSQCDSVVEPSHSMEKSSMVKRSITGEIKESVDLTFWW
jgi:hypothetical protein